MAGAAFDVSDLLQRGAEGKVAPPSMMAHAAPETPEAAAPAEFDVMGLLKQGSIGKAQAPMPLKKEGEGTGIGMVQNFAARAGESADRFLGAIPDVAQGAINLVPRGINAAAGTKIPLLEGSVGTTDWWMRNFGNPQLVQPTGWAERAAGAAGGALATLPQMALGGAAVKAVAPVGSLLSRVGQSVATMPLAPATLPVMAGGAVGSMASDASPEWLKPYADILGNVAGGGVGMAAQEATRYGAGLVGRQLGGMGLGGKTEIGGQRVTGTQADLASQRVAEAAGPEGRQMLFNAPEEMVPGSQPTTAQMAPTPGLVSLEQSARVANPAPFNERAQQQNNARVAAIQGTADEGAQAAAPGRLFAQQRAALQAELAGQAEGGKAAVAGATDALGGRGSPQTYGQQLRGVLQGAYDEGHPAVSRLWGLVDPEGKLALDVSPLRAAAKALDTEVDTGIYKRTKLLPEEQHFIDQAKLFPKVIPFVDLQNMRSDVLAAERGARADPTKAQTVRRLGMLKDAIDESIGAAVDGVAAQNSELGQRVRTAIDELAGQQTGTNARAGTGTEGVGGAESQPAGTGGAVGTAGAAGERPGNAAGSAGVAGAEPPLTPFEQELDAAMAPKSPEPPLEPNFSPADAEAHAAARAATLAEKKTFRTGAVGDVLQGGAQGVRYKIQDSGVPKRFFSGGPKEAEDVAAYIKAAGGRPEAIAAGRDYLVSELRDSGIIRADGTLDADKFARWRYRRANTIDQFPQLTADFGDALSAQRVYDQTVAEGEQRLKDFQNGAAKHFLNDEPIVAVRKAFGDNSGETFKQLVGMVKGNPDAVEGLKRAVTDFIMEKFSATAPSGASDVDFLKSDMFRRWMRTNREALKTIYGGQGAQNLEAVAADLRRAAQRTMATPGSDSAQKLYNLKKEGLLPHSGAHGSALMAVGAILAEHAGSSTLGAITSGLSLAAAGALQSALKQRGIKTVNDLISTAMLHPEVARILLQRLPANGELGPVMARKIAAALVATSVAHGQAKQETQQ